MPSKVDFNSRTASALTMVNWARMMPGTANTKLITWLLIAEPKGVLKNTSRAAPIAIGEITIGRSRRVSMKILPRNSFLEIAYATGTATTREMIVEIVAVARLRPIAKSISRELSADQMLPQCV